MPTKNLKPEDMIESITNINQRKPLASKKKGKALQSKPSEKLDHLMQLVNGLPSTAKSWDEILDTAKEMAGRPLKDFSRGIYIFGDEDPDRPSLAMEIAPTLFKEQVDELRTPAREYVGTLHIETAMTLFYEVPYASQGYTIEETAASVLVRYERLIQARKILEEIAGRSPLIGAFQNFYSQTGIWPATTSLMSTSSGLDVTLFINEQGELAIKPRELLDALLGAQAERIRQCPICNNIFWASRIDQKACSKRCSNIKRVRRSRELHQERGAMYEHARIKKAGKREQGQAENASKTANSKMLKQNKRKRGK